MFHPRHRSAAMRERLSGGFPASPILVYVGRLGAGAMLLKRVSSSATSCRRDTIGTNDLVTMVTSDEGDAAAFVVIRCAASLSGDSALCAALV